MSGKGHNSTDDLAKIGRAVIENAFNNNKFNTNLFKNKKEINVGWLILPISLYLVCCAIFLWIVQPNTNGYIFMFIVGVLIIRWLSATAHLKFESKVVTSITGVTFFLGLIIAAGLITPSQAIEKFEKYIHSGEESPGKNLTTK